MAMRFLLFLVVALSFPIRIVTKAALLERTLLSVFVDVERHNITCALPTLSQQTKCFTDPGIQGVMRHAVQLVNNCKESFMYAPWQCTTSKAAFKKGTRETAFLYALYTAALMYATSKACASNKLTSCQCATGITVPEFSPMVSVYFCSDNVEYGTQFSRSFLSIGHEDINQFGNTGMHNALIGLKVVKNSLERTCKRIGSCNVKFCFKRLKPFSDVVQSLKRYYQSALLWEPPNTAKSKIKGKFARNLLYTDQFSPKCDTQGRVCLHRSHCADLCCGRGFNTDYEHVYLYCNCDWDRPFKLGCEVCQTQKLTLTCK